jgi:hypothetical protein
VSEKEADDRKSYAKLENALDEKTQGGETTHLSELAS